MKMAPQEIIDKNRKGLEEMFKDQPTIGPDGKLIPPPHIKKAEKEQSQEGA